MRTSLYSRDPRQPVRFVTVAPIPEAEVLPPPTTPGIDLPLLEAKTIYKESAEYDLLIPPDEAEVMEQWAEEVARQRISDQVKELLEEKEASKLQTPLTIDTSSSESPFPCTSASPTLSEFPERPSAPGPLSPYSDDDDDFPLGIRRGSTLTSFKSFGESSVASEDVPPPQLAVSSVVLDRSKNGSSSSLPQTASPVVSLTKMLKLKLASPKSRSTSDLTALGYNDGVPLTRGRSGNISSLKQRFPVVKRLFGLGKGKAVDRSKDKNGRRVTPVPTAASIAVVKPVGQKRQRDDDEADENAPPNEEKERRIIRRRLVA
ncbi:hypothetical protein E1B28_013383 [Marasmius oreades]|uniref:Uncharacterized protein n=1 Tax=Marasmius oreades TaxID=181124 RepID=A0A9P7RQG5_9AGAR|nr:uncharacterized protein E1B28_013383 [Marasmius oreades]KAG7087415.1 hypothetical protein E1B28_013383 [Marasmius oreades]